MPPHKTHLRMLKVDVEPRLAEKPPVKVLMISSSGELGGAERSFFDVLKHLPRDRVEAHACMPPESPLSRLCATLPLHVHEISMRRFRRTTNPFVLAGQLRALHQSSKAIAAICREHGIDVIHGNTDGAALMAWEVSRMTKTPFIWHCRDMRPMHGFARALSSGAAAVFAISGAVQRHLIREGVKNEKIRLIYNGVTPDEFFTGQEREAARARTRASLGIPAHTPVVACVAAYVPWKRIEVFMKSLAVLRSKLPSAIGLLIGSDTFAQNAGYAEVLKKCASELNLDAEMLRVLNQREDVPDLLAAADVLVSTSDNEPFGRVLAEAGASELPVVCTDSGAKAEIVEDGATGILAPPGDANAVAAACARLLNDAEMRQELGRNARARVEKHFDVRRTAEEVAAQFAIVAAR